MTKLIRYRNILLVLICGNILCSLFPFPPFVWRIGILVVCFLLLIKHRGVTFDLFEKGCLWLFYINVLYFLFNCIETIPSPTNFVNMAVSLMGFVGFSILSRRNVLTEKFVFVSMILLTICSIPNFFVFAQEQVVNNYKTEGEFTNNASSLFLWIIPLTLILRKKIWSLAVLSICVFFFILGAKRGNIIAAVPTVLLYVIFLFRGKETSKLTKVLIITGLIVVFWSAYNFIQTDAYFQYRLEQTLEGKTSGRDNIYLFFWNMWLDADNPLNTFFGWGYNGTDSSSIKMMAHCDWLEFLIDYGLFGVIVYSLIFIGLVGKIVKSKSLDVKFFFVSIFTIIFFKSLFSMCVLDQLFIMLSIAYGYSNQLFHEELGLK